MDDPINKPKARKKPGLLGYIAIVVVAIIVISALSRGKTPPSTNQNNNTNGQTNTKPTIEFSNVKINSEMGITTVIGEAINNDSKAHSFTLTVSLYDKDKKLLGTAIGTISNINGGETKIFTAMSTSDYSNADSYKVQVDTMISTTDNIETPIEFSNLVIKNEMGFTTVNGEAKNKDDKEHSFTMVIGFYDKDKKLIGTATGSVNNLSSGDTKTFTAMSTGDYSKADSYKIQVDTMVQ